MLSFLYNDPYFTEYIKKEQAKGVTVMLGLPEDGIPMFLAEDAKEFIKGFKGERKSRYTERKKGV